MRTENHGRAGECLHEALAVAPDHRDAQLALLALSLHHGIVTDPMHLERAEVLGSGLQGAPLGWALLHMVYRAQGKGPEADSCLQELARLDLELMDAGGYSAVDANGFMQAALLFLDLSLPTHAITTIDLVSGLRHSAPRLGYDVAVANARAYQLMGSETLAQNYLKEAARAAPHDDPVAYVIVGHMHHKAERYDSAIQAYAKALEVAPQACPLEVGGARDAVAGGGAGYGRGGPDRCGA